jgi:hypothetical protein
MAQFKVGERVKVKGRLEDGRRFHALKIKMNSDPYRWDEWESTVEWVNESARTFGLMGAEVRIAAEQDSVSWPTLKTGAFVKVSGRAEPDRFLAERILVQAAPEDPVDEIQGEIRSADQAAGTLHVAGLAVAVDGETRVKGMRGVR